MKEKKPRVYHFNTHLSGGAANAAINIFDGLNKTNSYDLTFFHKEGVVNSTAQYKKNYKCINKEGYQNGILNRIEASFKYRYYNKLRSKYLTGRPKGLELFAFAKQYYKTPLSDFGILPDLIHINWISNWIDYSSFFNSIPDETPIVWTLHDMNPFTGGCHYSLGCVQYKTTECKHCPQLSKYKNGAIVKDNWKVKLKALRNKNLNIVGNSTWTTKEAEHSLLFSNAKSFQTIKLSVDTNLFHYKADNQNIRKLYGIDKNAFLILLGAQGIDNPRKGIIQFLNTLDQPQTTTNIAILVFGSKIINQKFNYINPIFTGSIERDQLPKHYNSADLMIVPSLYEAYGLTGAEAIACGLPIIGFTGTGLEDIIIENQNGFLIENGNFQLMSEMIRNLAINKGRSNEHKKIFTFQTRKILDRDVEISAYMNLYHKLIYK